MSSSSSAVTNSSERFTGRVKWFNNKAGYGFITVTDGSKSGTDVFVHHSSIKVDSEQYKYLVQGEYIEFTLSNTKTSSHEFQAGDVSGIKGGKLMCETRRESRTSRTHYNTSKSEPDESSEPVKMPRSVAAPKHVATPKSLRPRNSVGADEWRYVGDSGKESGAGRDAGAVRGRGRGAGRDAGAGAGRGRCAGAGAGRGRGRG